MSITRTHTVEIYSCDWPHCANRINVDGTMITLDAYGWKGRLIVGEQPRLHVCPSHAGESQRQLLKALLEEEEKGYWALHNQMIKDEREHDA